MMQKNNFLNKNIKSGHSRVSLSGIFDARRCSYEIGKTLLHKRQLRGRSPITAFGDDGLYVYERQTARGFTLIELLVVVLIIGILAAVAVPQYQNAVDKARYMELITIGDALHKAEEVYYLANNKYTTNQEDLDLEVTIPEDIDMSISDSDAVIMLFNKQQPSLSYLFYLDNHQLSSYKGIRHCRVETNDERLKKLCQNITGNNIHNPGGLYWISPF